MAAGFPLRGEEGRAARWYAGGLIVVQLLWVGFLLLVPPALALPFFLLFAVCELAVPVIAENRGRTPWHAHHIAERYGLFTIILLGESLLGSANAIIDAVHEGEHLAELIPLAVLGLVVTCSLWWIYFWPAHHRLIRSDLRASLRDGYGHYVIFAAAGVLAAGLELQIDVLTGHSEIHDPWASLAFSVPIAVFMLAIWALAYLPVGGPWVNVAVPTAAVPVLVDPVPPVPLALSALPDRRGGGARVAPPLRPHGRRRGARAPGPDPAPRLTPPGAPARPSARRARDRDPQAGP